MKWCVPIREKTLKEAQKGIRKAHKAGADLAEIWLDRFRTDRIAAPLPLVAVCKKPVEKGHFKGDYTSLARVLKQAAAWARYVDIPLKMNEKSIRDLIKKIKKKSEIIISYHNFTKTPPDSFLLETVKTIRGFKPDVIKIACLARSERDALRLIGLARRLQKAGLRHIVIGMGDKGKLTRILAPVLGAEMMFAPLARHKKTAPGQLTINEFRKAWNLLEN